MRDTARSAIIGGVVGALVGLAVGLLLHGIFDNGGSLIGYEVLAALFGVIFGLILGAFYGGALTFGRKDPPG